MEKNLHEGICVATQDQVSGDRDLETLALLGETPHCAGSPTEIPHETATLVSRMASAIPLQIKGAQCANRPDNGCNPTSDYRDGFRRV
jgi:hypothetical protein